MHCLTDVETLKIEIWDWLSIGQKERINELCCFNVQKTEEHVTLGLLAHEDISHDFSHIPTRELLTRKEASVMAVSRFSLLGDSATEQTHGGPFPFQI